MQTLKLWTVSDLFTKIKKKKQISDISVWVRARVSLTDKTDYSIWWNYHIYNKTFSAVTRVFCAPDNCGWGATRKMQPVNVRQVWQTAEMETTDGCVTERRRKPDRSQLWCWFVFFFFSSTRWWIRWDSGFPRFPPSREAASGPWLGSVPHECNLDECSSLAFGLINNNINSNYCDRLINPFRKKRLRWKGAGR